MRSIKSLHFPISRLSSVLPGQRLHRLWSVLLIHFWIALIFLDKSVAFANFANPRKSILVEAKRFELSTHTVWTCVLCQLGYASIERFYSISAKPSSDRKQELYECSLGWFEIGACIAVIYAAASLTKCAASWLSENRTYYSAEANYSRIKALRLVAMTGFEPALRTP